MYITPTILVTKFVRGGSNFKGGLQSYEQFKRDILKLVKDKSVIISTLIDFYALPSNFPLYQESTQIPTIYEKVSCLENAIKADIGAENLIPYLQIHEFEALLFADIKGFNPYFSVDEKDIQEVNKIIGSFPNPELINDSPITAPSKRLLEILPSYKKTFQGILIAMENGIENMLQKCPHFANWAEQLKKV